MATELRIPDSQKAAFASLLSYESSKLTSLQSALADLRPAIFLHSSASQVAESTGLDETEIANILVMLSSLFTLHEQGELTRDRLVDQLAAALQADPELAADPENTGRVASFLRTVLSLDETLGVTSKSWAIARDFERTYCFSKILTDVRPVFSPRSDAPAAAVVVHSLKLAYHEGEDLNEFFLGLTSRDLANLKRVIERAERKEASLRAALANSKLKLLEVE